MDYEKEYKAALERASIIHTGKYKPEIAAFCKQTLEAVFPELKNYSDMRIIKEITFFLKQKGGYNKDWTNWLEKQAEQKSKKVSLWKHWKDGIAGNGEGQLIYLVKVDNTYRLTSCLGFECDYIELSELDKLLEKQGENPQGKDKVENVNKVKSRLRVGDWVVRIDGENFSNGRKASQITNIEDSDFGVQYWFDCGTWLDAENIRHWTIEDAKDGDVLVCESGWTCIFKKLVNDETFSSHCFMDHTKWFCETGSECHTLIEEFVKAYNGKIYPATEEQRKLFFQKMEGAGYKWDTNNKQLIKLL